MGINHTTLPLGNNVLYPYLYFLKRIDLMLCSHDNQFSTKKSKFDILFTVDVLYELLTF